VFGQNNRLLPAKASCRAVAHLNGAGEPVELAETAVHVAREAALLGDMLRALDERHGFGRDDALGTAFPNGEEKARLRYANQFVGSLTKDGRLCGLLADFGFLVVREPRSSKVELTAWAWEFARMSNPVIDEGSTGPDHFSDEEVTFLLRHVRANVPAEGEAYSVLLRGIAEDKTSPTAIDEFLRSRISAKERASLSESYLATQRSGALSRMAELGLIRRVRAGVNMTYEATKRGMTFLKEDDR